MTQTDLERVAEAYASAGDDTMDVLEDLSDEQLDELNRTLQGIQGSIELIQDRR